MKFSTPIPGKPLFDPLSIIIGVRLPGTNQVNYIINNNDFVTFESILFFDQHNKLILLELLRGVRSFDRTLMIDYTKETGYSVMSWQSLKEKYQCTDGYQKRAYLYLVISFIGLSYEFLFIRPMRTIVILLWLGVFGIGLIVKFMLQEPER